MAYTGTSLILSGDVTASTLNATDATISTSITVDDVVFSTGGGSPVNSVSIGVTSLQNNTTGTGNTALGYRTLRDNVAGSSNTAIGAGTLIASDSEENTACGASALQAVSSGDGNTGLGRGAGYSTGAGGDLVTTGSYNTFLGYISGINTGTGDGCLAIGAGAIATISNGSGSGNDGPGIAIGSATYPVGFRGDGTIYPGKMWRVKVNGTNFKIPLATDASTSLPVPNGGTGIITTTAYAPICGGTTATGALQSADTGISNSGYVLTSNGSADLPTWQANDGGIVTIAGDSGTATGTTVTLTSGASGNSGYTVDFSATGSTVTFNVTDATTRNTFIGKSSGNATATGTDNVCIGGSNGTISSMASLTTGNRNLAIGNGCLPVLTEGTNNIAMCGGSFSSLILLTTGGNNISLGSNSSPTLTTGGRNVCIGVNTGTSFAADSSSNICIGDGAAGTSASHRLQIGKATGSGTSELDSSFIHGIRGITTANADAIAVLVDSAGQLGTVSSSARFKENIVDMGDDSSNILNLRPVKFNFKDNAREGYGLIAEEVQDTFPYLCAMDSHQCSDEICGHTEEEKAPKPFSVKYHELPVLLLNELKKALKRIDELESKLL